ncbi:hypothetical protein OVN18_02740 [Microcella daejeonensis]|uniref:DNA modification methylase n=1 Tax=Microcella daejeonensis TaxID=2994971 RepID=A0A9E8S943_9MICO|nr:hypothetical protein [Microcella daejeonensis]WAB81953.1 hypothetical protein OVN18_02740 [Microcella daejeonensis]WAB84120.1 hypothetical protein OVN20_00625 [Microcella daejeonensis]
MKSRTAAAVALSAALLLGTTGCTFGAEIATNIEYEPSDGVGGTVGDLSLRNALLIGEDGDVLNLVVSIVNSGDSARNLTVQWEGESGRESAEFFVPAGDLVSIGADQEVLVTGTDATIGSLVPVFFQYGDEPGTELLIPVLDGALPEYELFVPSTEE